MTTKNGYIIDREIDRGISGIVYSGKTPSGARVVLKQLSMEEGTREFGFIRKIASINGAGLANVIRCIDGFESDGDFYLVLESLGGTIESLVNHTNVTPYALAHIALGTIRGLAEIHRAGIAHCDVKQGNIGVSRRSKRIVVMDLASAVEIGERTRGYSEYTAAPEVLEGHPTETSDTYAWGRLVELILTGMVRITPGYPLQDVVPWVGRKFADLVARCTAESFRDRPNPIETVALAKDSLKLQPRHGCQCLCMVGARQFDCGH